MANIDRISILRDSFQVPDCRIDPLPILHGSDSHEMAAPGGFEPPTSGSKDQRPTVERQGIMMGVCPL